MLRSPTANLLIRLAFFATLATVFICAVMPRTVMPVSPHVVQGYKFDHMLAFFVLTVLATAAYPAVRLAVIGVLLSGYGGLIELVQALPFVARDASYRDWLIDTAAVLATMIPIVLARSPAIRRLRTAASL